MTKNPDITDSEVLAEALLNAGKAFGLSKSEISNVIGLDLTANIEEIEPKSQAGGRAIKLIRCYFSLLSLTGGRAEDLQHWMHTDNKGTGGVPSEQIETEDGLARVLEYLDAMHDRP